MHYDALKVWVDLFQTIFMGGISIWIYLANRAAARKKDVHGRLQTLNDRMIQAEGRIEASPDHEDLAKIYHRIEKTNDILNKLVGEFEGVRHSLNLINEHLLRDRR